VIQKHRLVSVAVISLLLAVAPPAMAQEEAEIELIPVDVTAFDISSVAPADWPHIGSGRYARGTPPEDWTLLALQGVQGTPADLLPLLQRQLAIEQEPAPTGEYSTAKQDWTLYRFDTALPDPVAGEAAMAQDGDTTYLAMLLAAPEEFAALRQAVLLPALDAHTPLVPEPTIDPDTLPYQVEEVAFAGGADDVTLAGTLTLPVAPGPHPVVLLLSGSGAQDRDETLKPVAMLKPFALIADALTAAGVGVLRYDDRGVGESTGDRSGLTLDGIRSDASAALDYLASREDIDLARIGLLGHSEGGLISASLGAADPRVAFIVNMAGPAVDGMDVLREQNAAILRSSGQPEDLISSYTGFLTELYPLVLESDEDGAVALASGYFAALWDNLPDATRELTPDKDAWVGLQVDSLVDSLIRDPDTSPWFRSFFGYDPGPDWGRVTVPVLGLFGGKDVQVLADQNAPALRAALESAGNTDFQIVILPDANHLFQAADTGAPTEYPTLEPEFTADFLPTVVEWLTVRAGVAE
jgi:pimeloyl-ACP methyl ester carboxylesterase